jgi:hypothetical protein
MLDPRLSLLGREQFHEVLAFQIEQPMLKSCSEMKPPSRMLSMAVLR